MSEQHTITVDPDAAMRLDRFLAQQFPEHSRSYLQQLIRRELVLVDDKPARQSLPLKAGMVVHVTIPEQPALTLAAEDIDLPILYEDDQILVINKPAGMPVHPGAGTQTGTVVNALLGYDFEQFNRMVDAERRPGVVHRLDKDTTGAMVIARTPMAKARLGDAFAERRVYKEYLALTDGRLPRRAMKVKTRIGRHPRHRKRMTVVDRGGKPAISIFRELAHRGGYALILANIETGRTHQIRVHLQHLGCPVVGDDTYGRKRSRTAAARQLLHAWHLRIPHPATGEFLDFTAPTPADMLDFAATHDLALESALREQRDITGSDD